MSTQTLTRGRVCRFVRQHGGGVEGPCGDAVTRLYVRVVSPNRPFPSHVVSWPLTIVPFPLSLTCLCSKFLFRVDTMLPVTGTRRASLAQSHYSRHRQCPTSVGSLYSDRSVKCVFLVSTKDRDSHVSRFMTLSLGLRGSVSFVRARSDIQCVSLFFVRDANH